MTTNDSPWMNLSKEAPEYAKRGSRFLRKEVQAGRLRAARIGGRGEMLTRREWIDEWIEQQATPIPVNFRAGFLR